MDKDTRKTINLLSRYLTILVLGIGNFYFIYKLLTFPTIYTTNFILSIFTRTDLVGNTIILKDAIIQIAPPCVAGSAFYLLLALILATSDINPKTRIYAIITAVSAFFILNVARILILTPMTSWSHFETIHWIFWHIVSTLFVVGTYIATIKIYKIKSIPVYSDIIYMKNLTRKHSKKRKRKTHTLG